MSQEQSIEGHLIQQSPIRIDGRSIQVTTVVISIAIIIAWSFQIGFVLEWIASLITVSLILSGLTMRRYSIRIIQESSTQLKFVRPGISWALASQSILGGSIVFATIFFFVNASITPRETLLFLIGISAITFTFLICPLLLLFSTLHPTWLKTIYCVELQPPYSLRIERACILDRNALAVQSNPSLAETIEEYIRSLFEPT